MKNEDIIKMVKAGLAEEIVLGAIEGATAKTFDLSPNGLVGLKTSGVSDAVILAMQGRSASSLRPTPEPARAVSAAVSTPARIATPSAVPRELHVTDGTEVKLRLVGPLSSAKARVEDRVDFEVFEDITVDGVVVIAKGASGTGRVIEAQSKRSFGRSGKLNFTIDSVKATDGQSIRLRTTRETKGGDSYGKAGVVTLLAGPFGALVKGKEVDIAAGTEYTIYIDGDRNISLKPAP